MNRATIMTAIASVKQAHCDEPLTYKLDRREIDDLADAIEAMPAPKPDALVDELRARIDGVVEFQGFGFWQTCTGCYESEDGHPNGDYPRSELLGCVLGAGCGECGGIGAVWDNIDWEAAAEEMIREEGPGGGAEYWRQQHHRMAQALRDTVVPVLQCEAAAHVIADAVAAVGEAASLIEELQRADLARAVKSLLPIGDATKPDNAVFPIYVRMSELRALHELAALSAMEGVQA